MGWRGGGGGGGKHLNTSYASINAETLRQSQSLRSAQSGLVLMLIWRLREGLNRPCPVGQSVLSHAVSSEESHQSTAEARSTRDPSQSVAPDQLTAFCILEASNGFRRCFGTRSLYTWVEGSVPGDQRSCRLAVEGGLLQRQVAATSLLSCHLAHSLLSNRPAYNLLLWVTPHWLTCAHKRRNVNSLWQRELLAVRQSNSRSEKQHFSKCQPTGFCGLAHLF